LKNIYKIFRTRFYKAGFLDKPKVGLAMVLTEYSIIRQLNSL